ncbi:MAG: hypothetical protein HQM12_23525, partial [SAR324 cluster bacterium]|nr:hypothetical protein [SAR324 cluster bacterium]
ETDLSQLLQDMSYLSMDKMPPVLKQKLDESLYSRNSMALLLEWLGKPVNGENDAQSLRMAHSAGAQAFRMIPNPKETSLASARNELERFWSPLPDFMAVKPEKSFACGNTSTSTKSTLIRYWWPQSLGLEPSTLERSPGFVIY